MITEARIQKSQFWANVATIIASIVAIAAFGATFVFFERTTDLQEDANAVSILNEHMKLFVEHPELHNCKEGRGDGTIKLPDGQCLDAAEHAAFTAETILAMAGDDLAWKRTVQGMVRDNAWWFRSQHFRRDRYDAEFVKLVQSQTGTSGSASPR